MEGNSIKYTMTVRNKVQNPVLGEPQYNSPIRHFVSDSLRLPNNIIHGLQPPAEDDFLFELAGARRQAIQPAPSGAWWLVASG